MIVETPSKRLAEGVSVPWSCSLVVLGSGVLRGCSARCIVSVASSNHVFWQSWATLQWTFRVENKSKSSTAFFESLAERTKELIFDWLSILAVSIKDMRSLCGNDLAPLLNEDRILGTGHPASGLLEMDLLWESVDGLGVSLREVAADFGRANVLVNP